MVKRVLQGLGVFIVVLIVGGIGIKTLILDSGKSNEEVLNNALVLGDTIIDMYREEVNPSSLDNFADKKVYSEDVVTAVQEYQSYLNELDEGVFNLSEYYYDNYESYEEIETDIDEFLEENPDTPLFEVAEDTGSVVNETEEVYDVVLSEDSSFIYYEGETAFMKVKDIPFDGGVALITFKGRNFELLEVNVPQTYTAIKKDTKYLYSYTSYMFDKESDKFIDLQYTSVSDPSETKIIRVFYDKRKTITGFTVR